MSHLTQLKEWTELSGGYHTTKKSINWNNLAFVKFWSESLGAMKDYWNALFLNDKEIDSIMFLIWTTSWEYKLCVYERNGEFSEFCWNGTIGAMAKINEEEWVISSNFILGSGIKVSAEIKGEHICIKTNDIERIPMDGGIHAMEKVLINPQIEIQELLDNPWFIEKEVRDISITTNLLQTLRNLSLDTDFYAFIQRCTIRDSITVLWEPHVLIQAPCQWLRDFMRDYYLKALSCLFRCKISQENQNNKGLNFMFFDYDRQEKGRVLLYPSERGVSGGIRYDQTWACGSGSMGLAWHLPETEIAIQNRSGAIISVTKHATWVEAYFSRAHIRGVTQVKSHNIQSESALENVDFTLAKLWMSARKGRYLEQLRSYPEIFPKVCYTIQDILGNILFSSCFHESEFPVDPYKITSSINAAHIASALGLDSIELPYLDTLPESKRLKGYPNIQPKWWKQVFTMVKELLQKIQEGQKNDNSDASPQLYKLMRNIGILCNIATQWENNTDISDTTLKDIIPEVKKIFGLLLYQIEEGVTSKTKIKDSEYGKYILDLSKSLWILDEFILAFWDMWRSLYWDIKEASLQWFIIFLLKGRVERNISPMLYKIVKKIIRTNFSEIQENDYIKIFHKIIQDETLTQFIKQNIPEGEQELLRKFHILNQKNEIEKNIYSLDTHLRQKLAQSLLEILEDEEFGSEFLICYLREIIEARNGDKVLLWEFQDKEMGFVPFQLYFGLDQNNQGELLIWRRWLESKGVNYLIHLVKNPENVIKLQWVLQIMIFALWNIPMIGSERWFREHLAKALRTFRGGKLTKFAYFVEWTKLFQDYDPRKKRAPEIPYDYNYWFPSWTDNSITWDLLMEVLIGWDLIRKKTWKLIELNLEDNSLLSDEKRQLLEELWEIFNKYNISKIWSDVLKKAWTLDEGRRTILEKKGEILWYTWTDTQRIILSLYQKYLLVTKN